MECLQYVAAIELAAAAQGIEFRRPLQAGPGVGLVCSLAALGILWLVLPRTANSAAGLGVVFLFTGLLGFGLGPTITYHLAMPGGTQVVMTALGGTGVIIPLVLS